MSALLTTLIATSPAAFWGAISGVSVLLINKFWPSKTESKASNRDDFNSITQSLLKEIEVLKYEINRYKDESLNCEKHYNELQDKFIEFRNRYNELELRYNIQVNINKNLAAEIKNLEEQLFYHTQKESKFLEIDDRQKQFIGDLKESSDRE